MAEQDRWERGLEKFKEVYCGDVAALPLLALGAGAVAAATTSLT